MWFMILLISIVLWAWIAYEMSKSPSITVTIGKNKKEVTSRAGKALVIFLLLPILFLVIWLFFTLIWVFIGLFIVMVVVVVFVNLFKSVRK